MNMPITLLTASVLGASTTAFAGDPLVWDNGDMYVEPPGLVWVFVGSVVTGSGTDNAIADDFILGQDTFVTGLQWSGMEWKSGMPDAFIIEFYASDPGGTTPTHGLLDPSETALASFLIQTGDIEATATDIWPGDDPFFHFMADLPAPFIASGGELYWISIQAYFEGIGNFGWLQSESMQLNSLATNTTDGMWETFEFEEGEYQGDMAFKLYGTPVPGPGALALLGVAALGKSRRRQR